MHCRAFRNSHTSYVDGLLSEATTQTMQEHASDCPRCGRLDVAVRRGLLVARNLPSIKPSPDFMQRLEARLSETEVREPTQRFSVRDACAAAVAMVMGNRAASFLGSVDRHIFAASR